jgi:hypothetical protein
VSISNVTFKSTLTAKGAFSREGLSGNVTLGGSTTIDADADAAGGAVTAPIFYTVKCICWGSGADATLDVSAGTLSTTTAEVRGTQQVETATAAGTITASGTADVTVTASGMTGSPKTLTPTVAINDTASDWAAKVRTALNADSDVTAMFTVGGSSTSITLTRKEDADGFRSANDGTLNIALENGTCTGITEDTASDNTTPGVVSSGTQLTESTGEDFEGGAIALTSVRAILVENNSAADTSATINVNSSTGPGTNFRGLLTGAHSGFAIYNPQTTDDVEITTGSSGGAPITIHVFGE